MSLQQYSMVRVRQLLRSLDTYAGWKVNQRPPRVDDVGTIIDILQAPGLPDNYVVEPCDSGGATIWLADFAADESEQVAT